MATLTSIFKLIDAYSGPAQAIQSSSYAATKAIDSASASVDRINVSSTKAADGTSRCSQAMKIAQQYMQQGYTKSEALSKAWDDVGRNAKGAGNGIGDAGRKSKKTASEVDGLTNKLTGLIAKLGGLMAIKKGMSITDDMTNLTARLDNMNDGLQSTSELQEKIFQSASRARGEYTVMGNAVSKLGTLAGDAFSSNDEIIAFTEVLQKSFKISGASTQEQSAAMLQLSQAMAAGRLQGDEYVSIMENAPAVIQSIAKYLNVSKGELKQMSSEGAITADVIKKAMFASADDINSKFDSMPKTFSDVWIGIKNEGIHAFDGIMKKVNKLLNNTRVQRTIDSVKFALEMIADAISFLIDLAVANWPVIEAILVVITTVHLISMITNLWAVIPPLIAQAGAWLAAYWPILLIIAVIAIVISAALQLGATVEDVTGFIGGIIGIFVTTFYNCFVFIWNFIAEFINFFGNVFNDPIASIQLLFLGLANNVIEMVRTMVKGIEDLINLIPGVNINITGGLDSLSNSLESTISNIKSESEWKEFVEKKEFTDFSDGFTKGQEMGESAGQKIMDMLDTVNGKLDPSSAESTIDLGNFNSGAAVPVEGSGKKSGKSVKVDISDENLKYIRDIAEKEYNITVKNDVLSPNMNVSFGDVHETADVKQIQKELEKIIDEEIATGKEG